MQRVLLLLMILLSVRTYGQFDTVITYRNGTPKYLLTFDNDGNPRTNTYLSIAGDTIYKWDIPHASMTEYPFTGEYLTRREYDSVKRISNATAPGIERTIQLSNMEQPVPDSREWRAMHDIFYKYCPNYNLYMQEGPFRMVVAYKDKEKTGPFKKYYNNELVVSGNYKQGIAKGIWFTYPYHFYPYYDITFANPFDYDATYYDPFGKQWSIIYYILPVLLGIVLLIILGKLAIRKERYNLYYYIVLALAVVAIVLRLGIPYRRDVVSIRYVIPAMWLVLWHGMLFLTTMNLFIGKRTNTRTLQNVLLLLIGLGCSIYVLFFKYLTF